MDSNGAIDGRIRALATLRSLKATLEGYEAHFPIGLGLVERYHLALEKLEAGDERLADFRVPDSWVIRAVPGRINTTPHVRRELLLQLVSEVLGYFDLRGAVAERAAELGERPERLIGFEAAAHDQRVRALR